MTAEQIAISLSRDGALVLFEWLARTGASEQPVAFEDQAEQSVLWDLEAGAGEAPDRAAQERLLRATGGRSKAGSRRR
ncbi:MAG TPA: hypothetical protein VFJ97_02520 [Dermatophilaceae bacterium]|nr:hypothetical protein [Dermatophilaceae bacterium]